MLMDKKLFLPDKMFNTVAGRKLPKMEHSHITFIAMFVVFILGFIYVYSSNESSDMYKYGQPLIVFENGSTFSSFNNSSSSKNIFNESSSRKIVENVLFDHCVLPELDPWDPTITPFIWTQEDPAIKCKPKVKQISQLIHGQLFLSPQRSNVKCFWRCLYLKDEYSIDFKDKWHELINGSSKPFCDIIEVECKKPKYSKPFYKFLHAQTFRLGPVLSSTHISPPRYDVHLIIFDSVSQSQFIRSMPKTRHILRQNYESIAFPNLNKIGLNSRPNGFGFLFGKSIYSMQKSPISRGYTADYPGEAFNSSCFTYLDDDQFIGFRFQDDDYVTMMSEDQALGVVVWPYCLGFKKKPVDHYMRPFQLRVESANGLYISEKMRSTVYENSCKESFHHQIEYLKDFLKTYPDRPKFSITWMTYLAHDDQNALSHADNYFYRFLSGFQKDLENSFVFLMGDHGLRFGQSRDTAVGEVEDNNPFLFLSVPKDLRRKNSLINNLKDNSKELITHYDIYATLTEIANPSHPRTPKPLLKGSSLFRPLPQPRGCDRLRIPFEYCICKTNKTRLPKINEIAFPAAKLMVSQMNSDLMKYDETNGCTLLTLDENAEIFVDEFDESSNVKIYQVTYSTLPGNGKFWGLLSQDIKNGTIKILSEKFPRLNMYYHQAGCALYALFASYCYCENLENLM